jgi:transposase
MSNAMWWRSHRVFRPSVAVSFETLGTVYSHDAEAREQRLSPKARLAYHQMHSGPVLTDLHVWLTAQLADHLVEPNSSLASAP